MPRNPRKKEVKKRTYKKNRTYGGSRGKYKSRAIPLDYWGIIFQDFSCDIETSENCLDKEFIHQLILSEVTKPFCADEFRLVKQHV